MVARTPSVPYCRSVEPRLLGRCREVAGPLPQPEPDEVGLGVGDEPALPSQHLDHPGAFCDQRVHALLQLVERRERRHGRSLRDRVHAERRRRLAQGGRDRRVRHGIADAKAGQAVGLGEGAQHHDVGAVTVELEAARRLLVGDELDVGLVDDDEHAGGHVVEEPQQLGMRDHRAGGVVGGADDDDLGAVGDRRAHGVEPVTGVVVERDLDRAGARERRDDRVGLERPPRVDDLVARVAGGRDDLAEDTDRTGAGGDVLGRDPEGVGERLGELGDGHVGVAVDRPSRLAHHLEDRWQRRIGVLVGRDLVCRDPLGRGRGLARDVGGHLVEGRAQADVAVAHGFTLRAAVGAAVSRRQRQG